MGRAGVLVVGLNPYRRFDDNYRSFLSLVAGQIAAGVANAQAYEEERRRAEALAEIDRAKTTFFSNISHEFRTPLTLMLGPLEDVLNDQVESGVAPAHRSRLEIAHRNSLRLLKLVNTLLDFSRIEAGRMEAHFEPTDLCKLTAELACNFESATEKAGLALSIDCEDLQQPVYVDHDMWEKIVLNLLANAFKFTFEGSIEVQLRASMAGQAVELIVRDTGVGIPESELARVFERFHRVEGQKSRSFEGSGIGLALVQELVKLHGGTIRVESQGRTRDSIYRFHTFRERTFTGGSYRSRAVAGIDFDSGEGLCRGGAALAA
jgi:signal transduction histidine kinase